MKTRFVKLLLLVSGVAVAVVLPGVLLNREPEYQGKRLSTWFKQYYRTGQWSRRSDERRHEQAARAMRAMGTNAIPFLATECFKTSRESPFQTNVAVFLSELPQPFRSPPFVPAMSVREEAANAIGEIKPPASLLLPLVTNWLNDPDKFQRCMAVYLLGRVGEGGEAAVPFLREKLGSADPQELALATLSFDRLGSASGSATTDLIEFVRTNSYHPIYYACRALARIGPAASNALPVLKARLADETNAMRQASIAVALICIDSHQAEAMGVLETQVADTNTPSKVVYALQDIGTNAKPALPLLLTAINHPESVVWHQALSVILSLGETNLAISSAMEKLNRDDAATRFNAMKFLLRAQPTNAAAMSNLVVEVNELKWGGAAIGEAARLGALAQPVIPKLRVIATSKTNLFRETAQKALMDIEALAKEEREAR